MVGEVGDLREHLLVYEVGDLADHARVAALLDTVGELADHDRGLAAAQLFDVGARAHHDAAAAGSVRIADARAPDDVRTGREVRAFDVLHQAFDVDRGVVDHRDDSVDRLGRAVDQQIREAGRQRGGLAERLVVVRPEVDRVRVDVAQHLRRHP